MRAIIETVFDIFYLAAVLTVGIRMIRGSKSGSQFKLFGLMAVVLRFLPPGTSCTGSVHHRPGELRCSPGPG